MKQLKTILAAAVVCGAAFASRADYLWTWHGNSNFFQGSFEVTDEEMLPNSHFNSSLFTNSISFSSLDGVRYFGTNSFAIISGGFQPPLHLSLVLLDESTFSRLSVVVVPGQGSRISETSSLPFGNNFEDGYWTYAQVPEPTTSALLALGAMMLASKISSKRQRDAAAQAAVPDGFNSPNSP